MAFRSRDRAAAARCSCAGTHIQQGYVPIGVLVVREESARVPARVISHGTDPEAV
jgi:hypothetical protein